MASNYSSLKTTMIFSIVALLSLLHSQFSNAVKGGYWSPDNGLEASDIDSTLFTHLFCAFANLNNETGELTIPAECTTFSQAVRQNNPSVKTLLSIGGGDAKSSDFNTITSNPTTRKTFIDSSIDLATSNAFDGLDLDWEQQSNEEEMNNMATLLEEWRAAINAQSSPLILTAALRFTATADTGVPFPARAIADNLDWVNVMAYDFYAPAWSPQPFLTRPHAALYDPSSDVSGSSGVRAWMDAGVPAEKLVLGFPFYGYAWQLVNAEDNGILAPSTGGDTSVGNGQPKYSEIKDFISQTGATVVYNSSYVTNYCYSDTTWIAYDDTETIAAKVEFVKNTSGGLLGYFAWNICQDQDWALSQQASQTWEE